MIPFLEGALDVSFAMLVLAIVVALLRLLRGPTLADRVVALDLIGYLAVAFIALFAVRSLDAVFLDVALALALVAFLATVAYARLVERQVADRDEHDG